MICSTLASLKKFQYFRRPVYNPVEYLWHSFYCEKSKPLSIFIKRLHHRCSLGFHMRLCFLKTLQTFYYFTLLGDSRNYMPPILIPSSAKRIPTHILVIAILNGRKNFISRVFVCDIIRPSKKLPVQSSNLSTRIRRESCSILRMSMLTTFNINDVNGVVLVSLLLTVNIFQTLF